MRRGLRLVQGASEPASSPADACLVPVRRTCDLVDGRSRERAGRACAAAVLRRGAHDPDERERGADPVRGGGLTVMSVSTHTRKPRNLAARMGRWSASHWKTAPFACLAFVPVAFALGAAVGTKNVDQNAPGPGESGRMDRILDDGFKQPAGENVLIQSRTHRAGDPAFKAATADVVARVSRIADVQNVRRGEVAKKGRAALVEFDIRGDKNKAVDKIGPVIKRVAAVQRAHPGFVIGEFGDASSEKGVETAYLDDLAKAGELSLPI